MAHSADPGASMTRRAGDPRDAEIGQRVRSLRLQRGLSQTELGNLISVTFQQVQKYEKGANRISAGRLQRIAEVLGVPVAYFFAAPDQRHGSNGGGQEFELLQTEGALRLAPGDAGLKKPGGRQQPRRLPARVGGDWRAARW